MHPTLFHIGPVAIHTYGVFIALGFVAGIWLATSQAKREGMNPDVILDLAFYIIAAAIIGSRAAYVVINWNLFRNNLTDIFAIWKGGLVFYGGLLAGAPVVMLYLKKKDLDVWAVGDVLAPSLALGQAFGRLGCFSAGCCFGKPSFGGWPRVTFHNHESLAPLGVPLHPVQLYDAVLMLAIFTVLLLSRRVFSRFKGQLVWTYLLLFAPARFLLEELRADMTKNLFGGALSLTQTLSIVLFVLAAVMLARGFKGSARLPEQATS